MTTFAPARGLRPRASARPRFRPANPAPTRPPLVAADARLWAGWSEVPSDRPDPSQFLADGSRLHRDGGARR